MRYIKNQKQRGLNRSRRRFLDLVGRSGISTAVLKASPIVMGALTSRYVEAAPGAGKRAVFMYMGDGSPPGHWLPQSETQMNTATAPFGSGGPGVKGYNVAKYCSFFEVNNSWGEHGQTYKCMGETNYNPNDFGIGTLDTQLAKKNFFGSRMDIVRIGVQKKEVGFSCENGQAANFIEGPKKALADIFGGVTVSGTDKTYEKVFAMNAAAVDKIKNKLGQDERTRLDTHLATLEKIESSLAADANKDPGAEACGPVDRAIPEFIDECYLTADIVVAALKCGITNVASVMFSDNQAAWNAPEAVFKQLNLPVGSPNEYHSANHSEGIVTRPGLGRLMSVLEQVPAYFLSQLATETAPGESSPLINSTLLCQLNDMGFGDHSRAGAPWILASGSTDYGLGKFSASASGTNLDVLRSIPGRMGLDGKIAGA